jgi:hypothetical protein
MERRTWPTTFRQNHVKLAWAFINIMNVAHHCVLHNDLSKDNIMLHFLLNKWDFVYIGVSNWGEVEHLPKVTPSLYGFANTTKNHNFLGSQLDWNVHIDQRVCPFWLKVWGMKNTCYIWPIRLTKMICDEVWSWKVGQNGQTSIKMV